MSSEFSLERITQLVSDLEQELQAAPPARPNSMHYVKRLWFSNVRLRSLRARPSNSMSISTAYAAG